MGDRRPARDHRRRDRPLAAPPGIVPPRRDGPDAVRPAVTCPPRAARPDRRRRPDRLAGHARRHRARPGALRAGRHRRRRSAPATPATCRCGSPAPTAIPASGIVGYPTRSSRTCEGVRDGIAPAAALGGAFPVVLGGCCALVPGVAAALRRADPRPLGLAYIDGHMDPTPRAHQPHRRGRRHAGRDRGRPRRSRRWIARRAAPADRRRPRIALLAHRDRDEARRLGSAMPDELGIGSRRDCDDVQGEPGRVGGRRPTRLAPDGGRFWLSIDVDVLSSEAFAATPVKQPGGLSAARAGGALPAARAAPGLRRARPALLRRRTWTTPARTGAAHGGRSAARRRSRNRPEREPDRRRRAETWHHAVRGRHGGPIVRLWGRWGWDFLRRRLPSRCPASRNPRWPRVRRLSAHPPRPSPCSLPARPAQGSGLRMAFGPASSGGSYRYPAPAAIRAGWAKATAAKQTRAEPDRRGDLARAPRPPARRRCAGAQDRGRRPRWPSPRRRPRPDGRSIQGLVVLGHHVHPDAGAPCRWPTGARSRCSPRSARRRAARWPRRSPASADAPARPRRPGRRHRRRRSARRTR